MSSPRKRRYPSCCTSAYCGDIYPACDTCPNGPVRAEFLAWVERTAAKELDPIWCRNLFTATKEDPQ